MLFNDASFANLPDETSSTGGRVVFLFVEGDKYCPISWSSTKIKRVVRSTLAAETLSLADGCESVFVIGCLLTELIYGKSDQQNRIPIKSFVDNKSLVQNVHSTTMVLEKRLRIEMGVIYEMIHDNKMSIKWIEASKQLADSLTKRGASSSKLNQVLVSGRLRPPWEDVVNVIRNWYLICWLHGEICFGLYWWEWYLNNYDDFDLLKVLVRDRLLMDIFVQVDIGYVENGLVIQWPLVFGFDICFIGVLCLAGMMICFDSIFYWSPHRQRGIC